MKDFKKLFKHLIPFTVHDPQTTRTPFAPSKGTLTIELFWSSAPNTCRNFAALAERKYYDNTVIHRIVKDRILQAGDPTGTGRGGESIYGGYFADEIDSELKHLPGMVASANAGPNMNKSQFYITLATCQTLDKKSTIFGKVIPPGLEILKRFNSVKTDKRNCPLESCKIVRAQVRESLTGQAESAENPDDESDDDDSLGKDAERNNLGSYFIS